MKRTGLIIILVILTLAAVGCKERYACKSTDSPYLILYAFADEGELLAQQMQVSGTDRQVSRWCWRNPESG